MFYHPHGLQQLQHSSPENSRLRHPANDVRHQKQRPSYHQKPYHSVYSATPASSRGAAEAYGLRWRTDPLRIFFEAPSIVDMMKQEGDTTKSSVFHRSIGVDHPLYLSPLVVYVETSGIMPSLSEQHFASHHRMNDFHGLIMRLRLQLDAPSSPNIAAGVTTPQHQFMDGRLPAPASTECSSFGCPCQGNVFYAKGTQSSNLRRATKSSQPSQLRPAALRRATAMLLQTLQHAPQ